MADGSERPAAATAQSVPLEYDRSTANHVTRGQFRIFLILFFINTVALGLYVLAPQSATWIKETWNGIQTRQAQREAARLNAAAATKRRAELAAALPSIKTFVIPGEFPVYTEDPVECASLLASDQHYESVRSDQQIGWSWQPAVARTMPQEIAPIARLLRDETGRIRTAAHAFIHARANPRGEERLIVAQLLTYQMPRLIDSNTATITTARTLNVELLAFNSAGEPFAKSMVMTDFDQTEADRTSVKRSGEPKTPQVFRLLAGEADANDATRFTIPYTINGARGVFVGRILEGDKILIEPSDGRIIERSEGRQKWDLSAPPAVKVSPTTK